MNTKRKTNEHYYTAANVARSYERAENYRMAISYWNAASDCATQNSNCVYAHNRALFCESQISRHVFVLQQREAAKK